MPMGFQSFCFSALNLLIHSYILKTLTTYYHLKEQFDVCTQKDEVNEFHMMMLTSLSRNPILAKSNPSIRIKQASLESTLQTSHTKLEKKIKTLGFVVS